MDARWLPLMRLTLQDMPNWMLLQEAQTYPEKLDFLGN